MTIDQFPSALTVTNPGPGGMGTDPLQGSVVFTSRSFPSPATDSGAGSDVDAEAAGGKGPSRSATNAAPATSRVHAVSRAAQNGQRRTSGLLGDEEVAGAWAGQYVAASDRTRRGRPSCSSTRCRA